MIESLIIYLVLGSVAGVVAGLFGIGGGLLIVPVLIFSFTAQGMPEAVVTHSAVATSLATIVITSISSVIAHNKRGAVRFDYFFYIAIGVAMGAMVGVWIADQLTGENLQLIFGIFACTVAVQMAFDLKPKRGMNPPEKPELIAAGSIIGGASSIFGIGGGTLSVPYLTVRGAEMRQAVGTSAAIGLPIALFSAAAYIWAGQDAQGMPEYSLGYIYLPAFVGIALASSQFAKVGAKLAHTLPQAHLKKIFALFLVFIGSRFLLINLGLL
ncbi:sulfite exporter TauE/SafE family protein [Marinobacterium sp. LSUCC0821]|jgi:uncharacterized membrane protein YfcA|uniref:sulfite exporter TauE/SafE family protein n=1 Tax=Marinobacterium sp. LSUCC0821 TaxID=2668067 RepID=UPI001451A50A|nr:sulfite exporter TauE/SafE family protein [Marinobacterium sp. LSUCC0821]QJD71611.1 sulfite exporter TauE/SafE family protein [Marinobacterium sp. LSUCC0821]